MAPTSRVQEVRSLRG